MNLKLSYPWINPIGGYGDMLMVSGVLCQLCRQDPSRRFNLIRRTRYTAIFRGHEAIELIDYLPPGAAIQRVDYWALEPLGPGAQRPYQILARAFGLPTPSDEYLYLPGVPDSDPLLEGLIPWSKRNVVIAPASDSPRKAMLPSIWHHLVDMLLLDGTLVIQVGLRNELHIRNTYSLLGQTTPQQVVALLRKVDLVVTADNFIMHAAHLAGVPAVVMWGPTQHQVYGYPEQIHIQEVPRCDLEPGESCIVSEENAGGQLYDTRCPLGDRHCVDQIPPERIFHACYVAMARGARGKLLVTPHSSPQDGPSP